MSSQLERTVDFTKYTLGLAAAGFAYVAEVAVKRQDWYIKGAGLVALLCFALSVVFGGLVFGRATKIETLDNETTLQQMGKLHSLFLILGLAVGAIVIFVRIIRQGE
jgi:hypothetical protein